jgi:outer membrane lipoprotein-sorting protein
MSSRLLRWFPAVVAPVVVAGAVAVPLVATASADLPAKSPDQVLALVAASKSIAGFTGTVQQTSDLGLPELPTTGAGTESATASTLNLLTGTHSARVEVSGSTKSRVAVLDRMGERDVVRDGRTVWLWNSAKNTATRLTVSSTRAQHPETGTMTPGRAADLLLSKVEPSTAVTVDTTTSVAGHAAYSLVLTPKATDTTVGSVRIAVDGTTGLPLEVQALARGSSSPAFDVRFTSLTYSVPADARFHFSPPAGASAQQHTLTPRARHSEPPRTAASRPTVTGSGWDAVVTVPAVDVPAALAADPTYLRLTQAVPGGRALTTSLVNVLRADDGRVLAGAVPLDRLQAVAAAH